MDAFGGCVAWQDGTPCYTGYPPVNTPAAIALLVASCPVTCADVTPVCVSTPPPPPPPLVAPVTSPPPPPASGPQIRCTDDPTYLDIYACNSWVGYSCRSGGYGVSGAARIALLVASCPVSCTDVTPICAVASPPPPPADAHCIDNPAYTDAFGGCSAWADGTPCRTGYPPVNTAAAINLLITSCPVTCVDVTPPPGC